MKRWVAFIIILVVLCGCAGPQVSYTAATTNLYEGGIDEVKYFVQPTRAYEILEGKEIRMPKDKY